MIQWVDCVRESIPVNPPIHPLCNFMNSQTVILYSKDSSTNLKTPAHRPSRIIPKVYQDMAPIADRFPIERLLAACMVLAIFGCAKPVSVSESRNPRKPVSVKTVTVVQQEVQRTTMQPASVRAFYQTDIRAKVSGYVTQVAADIGDFVEAGKSLATIDVPEMSKEREIIEARIASHEAGEKQASAGVKLASAGLIAAAASLEESKSERDRYIAQPIYLADIACARAALSLVRPRFCAVGER